MALFMRDGWRCVYCRTSQNLTPHHIVYRSKGGKDDLDNLLTLCFGCHNAVHNGNLFVTVADGFVNLTPKRGWKP